MKLKTKFLIGSVAIVLTSDLAVWVLHYFDVRWVLVITLLLSIPIVILLNLLFKKLVASGLSDIIAELARADDEGINTRLAKDEMMYLKASFGHLNRYVRVARKGSGLEPNFVGKYLVEKPLMACSMSWLYQGKNTQTQEPVWIKIPFDNALTNPIYAASIRTERKLFEQMKHPNLLKLKDNLGDVLIMEAPEAESFAEYIYRKSRFTKMDILPYFQQLCDLLSYLHHQGVVHHNLRPESMVISKERDIRLIDLGLAFWADFGDPLSETELCPQGDKRYMAPEQSEGKRGDPRSDIYTLGVLLYLMLTGKTPSESEEEVPVSVRPVISKAMAPNPDQRYQWVEDFSDDLQNKVAALEIYV